MSLRSKLFGAISVTLCVVLGILVVLTLIEARERARHLRSLHDAVLELAADLGATRSAGWVRSDTRLVVDGELHPALASLAAFRDGEDGEPEVMFALGRLADVTIHDEVLPLVREAAEQGRTTSVKGDYVATVLRPVGGFTDVLVIEARPIRIDPADVSRQTFLVVVAALLLLLVITWLIVGRVVSQPLGQVVSGAQRVADGDYSMPVPSTGGDDEIQKVIASFNAMMGELGRLRGRLHERIDDALDEARRTQDSLVIAQRLAATGQLAAGIAHEVNNPLGGMLNAVHALRTKDMQDAKREEYFAIVDDGLKRIQATVSKILQFTPHNIAPQPVDLSDVVRPVVSLVSHRLEKESAELVLELTEGARVFGDPYELQQALLNVVLNALDSVSEAGRSDSEVRISTLVGGDEVRLQVRDNGVGLSEEDAPRVFDLFFTTKETGKGSGLGLATAHKIVTDHGGRLELRSREHGAGVVVEFTFPLLRE